MMTKDLVAASSRPMVLSILAGGESYGYAIIQRVRELSGERIEWTDGMLYPVLHRLEKEGLVASRWKQSETGRDRKYYRLKPEGRAALEVERPGGPRHLAAVVRERALEDLKRGRMQIVVTTDQFGGAEPLMDDTRERAQEIADFSEIVTSGEQK